MSVELEELYIHSILEKIRECRRCKNSGKIRQILGEKKSKF